MPMIVAVAVGFLFVLPAGVAAWYYFAFAVLIRRKRQPPADVPRTRFGIVVPAHNEEAGLSRSLRAIAMADYPPTLICTLVVADNCTDRTAEVARGFGVGCLERIDDVLRGKGYALAAGIPVVLPHVDAVLILDADCEFEPASLRFLDSALQAGASVVQATVAPRNPEEAPSALTAAAGAAIENAVAAGRSRLGLSIGLRGTGMAFRRGVLEAHAWTAFGLTEDRDFAEQLSRAGIRIRFAADAKFSNDAAPNLDALLVQRRRWRTGLFAGGLRRLVESKPLVLAHLATALLAFTATAWAMPSFVACGLGVILLLSVGTTAVVYTQAIRRAGVCFEFVPAMRVLIRLTLTTVGGLSARGRVWERTPRLSDVARPT